VRRRYVHLKIPGAMAALSSGVPRPPPAPAGIQSPRDDLTVICTKCRATPLAPSSAPVMTTPPPAAPFRVGESGA